MVDTINGFKKRWIKKSEEIKKQSFDEKQCYSIMVDFLNECMTFNTFKNDTGEVFVPAFEETKNDLSIALEIAHSNYRKQKKGFWSKIFSGKKELNLFKYK
jgi:hypothetical protein